MMGAGWVTVIHYDHQRIFRALLLTLLFVAKRIAAVPIDYFPINSQLPTVARVSKPFSFTFSPQTFSSPFEMTYTLHDGPSWLVIDSATRSLYGVPNNEGFGDAGGDSVIGIPISLVASDATGSTTSKATLVVSRNNAPEVAIPLSEQIQKFGSYASPASLLLRPSTGFSFRFLDDTFRYSGQNGKDVEGLNYYAVSDNNAPLPAWISFDGSTLSFSGETPDFESLIQPPQTFSFHLVASDVVGFSSASAPFSIVVGPHELTAELPIVKLNATRGELLEYNDLSEILKVDKRPLQPEDVTSITAVGLPPWAEFDAHETWQLSGTPDEKARPTNITVVIVDSFADELNLTVAIDFPENAKMFVSDLPAVDLVAGTDFSFDLKRYLFKPMETLITIESEPSAPWISFDPSSTTLSGTVPKPGRAGYSNELRVTLNATSRRSRGSETKIMDIHVSSAFATSSPGYPTATAAAAPDPEADALRIKLLIILLPTFLVVLFLIFLLLFYFRKRQQRHRRFHIGEVSAPIPGTFVHDGYEVADSLDEGSLQDMRKMLDIGPPPSRESEITHHGYVATILNPPSSQTASDPSIHSGEDFRPHALVTDSRARNYRNEESMLVESRRPWLAGQLAGRPPPEKTDETSLLSDTSLGEGDTHLAPLDVSVFERRSSDETFGSGLLGIPMIGEPFSIQPTPELAYAGGGPRYDFSSDDDVIPPAVGYAARRKSSREEDTIGLRGRGIGYRLSKAWKRASTSRPPQDRKRASLLSNTTNQTAQTSILTRGRTEEAILTSANVVAKPTVVHIPSKHGEGRQISRRTNESSPLFGGGALTKPQRKVRPGSNASPAPAVMETLIPPAVFEDSMAEQRESDTSWDRFARDSLGIAHKDLVRDRLTTRSLNVLALKQPEDIGTRLSTENWRTHDSSQDLMWPDKWPIPEASSAGLAIMEEEALRSESELPQPPTLRKANTRKRPDTPASKGKARAHQMPWDSGPRSIAPQTLSAKPRRNSSRDTRLRMSRVHEQRALNELRAMMSKTPSPDTARSAPPARPLPETPTGTGRIPLRARLNESTGNSHSGTSPRPKGVASQRSQKSLRSARSDRSRLVEDNHDEDAWEDILAPESPVGGWNDGISDRSFSVFI